MEKNYSLEQKQWLKEQQRKRKERRNKRILNVCSFIVITSLIITPLYLKANKSRECVIHSVEDNTVVVRHPNNNLYSFTTDTPEQFKKETVITVIFNELHDWDKEYTIKGVK